MTDAGTRVRRAVRECLMEFPAGSRVLVACSGGPDSVALAAAAAQVAERAQRSVGAVVVDHGLQAGSELVAQRAAQVCRDLGLDPVVVCTVDATALPGGAGPEAAARDARRAALHDVAAQTGAVAVLLGHTLDDQAETVLLGLARGSGARSLAGMRRHSGLFIRPLIDLPRAVVRAFAADLTVIDDPHNADPRYARARVRHDVLPAMESALGPGVADALARSADLLRDDADLLDTLAADAASALGSEPDLKALRDLPRALRTRVIRLLAADAGVPGGTLTRDHVLAVERLVVEPRVRGPVALPGGCSARKECGRLLLARSPSGHAHG